MLALLVQFKDFLTEKLVQATGGAFHWPNFSWPPPSDLSDTSHHHHHHHDEQQKTLPDFFHDLHL